MDFSEKQTIICYIDRNKILFYKDIDGSMLQMDFPPNVVSDQELNSREKLEHLIETFIDANKLEKGNILFIFASDMSIEKDFPDELAEKKNEEIQKFIDMIPFEEVLSKTYTLNKKTKTIAINQEIYESIKSIFAKRGYFLAGIIPSAVLQETFPELSANIDLAFIAGKIFSLKQYSMAEVNEPKKEDPKEKPVSKKPKTRIYLLVSVFAILLFILIAMVVINLLPEDSPKDLPTVQTPISSAPTLPVINQPEVSIIEPSIGTPSGSDNEL